MFGGTQMYRHRLKVGIIEYFVLVIILSFLTLVYIIFYSLDRYQCIIIPMVLFIEIESANLFGSCIL